jgi:hypothetical protein
MKCYHLFKVNCPKKIFFPFTKTYLAFFSLLLKHIVPLLKNIFMENNQQRKEEGNSSGSREAGSFTNQQAGQQLPTGNKQHGAAKTATSSDSEQHSESSKPERENETLGTP